MKIKATSTPPLSGAQAFAWMLAAVTGKRPVLKVVQGTKDKMGERLKQKRIDVRKNYQGPIGPADAMSALDPAFHDTYAKATADILAAVMEFERATGRIVDSIELQKTDVTGLHDLDPRHLRMTAIKFLPTPGEVAWQGRD